MNLPTMLTLYRSVLDAAIAVGECEHAGRLDAKRIFQPLAHASSLLAAVIDDEVEHLQDGAAQPSPKSPRRRIPKAKKEEIPMTHLNPTLRTASHPNYIPPAMRRKSDTPVTAGAAASTPDFSTVLKNQPDPAAADTAPVPRMIGTVSPTPPSVVVTVPAATTSAMAPTAQSLFGANPWSSDAGGNGPDGSYSYNPYYFATPATAAKVAQMLGGTVVAGDAITPSGPFQQNQPNQMVQMPDGRLINAGLVAGFYDHGYTQETVDKMIAAEVSGDGMYS